MDTGPRIEFKKGVALLPGITPVQPLLSFWEIQREASNQMNPLTPFNGTTMKAFTMNVYGMK